MINRELSNEYCIVIDDLMPREMFYRTYRQLVNSDIKMRVIKSTAYSDYPDLPEQHNYVVEQKIRDVGQSTTLLHKEEEVDVHPTDYSYISKVIEALTFKEIGVETCLGLMRSKLNCTFPYPGYSDQNRYIHQPHDDGAYYDDAHSYSSVFYLNECDGDTIIYDKQFLSAEEAKDKLAKQEPIHLFEVARVSPKPNRVVLFNANRVHVGEVPTEDKRFIINSVMVCLEKIQWIS